MTNTIDILVDEGIEAFVCEQEVQNAVQISCEIAAQIKSPIVCVRFASNEAVQSLNAAWRDKDKVTDVLSFPMQEAEMDADESLGDIILAMPFVAQEATRLDLPVAQHALHLIVHGTLHLMGYDHIDDEQAKQMQGLENKIMQQLKLHTPYPELGEHE